MVSPAHFHLAFLCSLAYFVHWRAPEVVEEDIPDGRVGTQVAVLLDGRDVVEDEAAVE
jgi:hypothetical protein